MDTIVIEGPALIAAIFTLALGGVAFAVLLSDRLVSAVLGEGQRRRGQRR